MYNCEAERRESIYWPVFFSLCAERANWLRFVFSMRELIIMKKNESNEFDECIVRNFFYSLSPKSLFVWCYSLCFVFFFQILTPIYYFTIFFPFEFLLPHIHTHTQRRAEQSKENAYDFHSPYRMGMESSNETFTVTQYKYYRHLFQMFNYYLRILK